MIINNLQTTVVNNRHRLSADIAYEDCDLGQYSIFFEVPAHLSEFIRASYAPFLLAAFPAAYYHAEKRISIEGDVCAELAENISAALLLQKEWYYPEIQPPVIEAQARKTALPAQPGVAGCFLSGGVDSLSNFCHNLNIYAPSHPKRIKAAVCVYGLDMGDPNKPDCSAIFDQTLGLLEQLTDSFKTTLIPVYTNARDLEKDWRFYEQKHYGAVLAGIAHFISGRLNECSITLDNRIDYFVGAKHGSHPLFNKYLSSSFLRIENTMDAYTRLDKYQFFINRPEALSALRTCYTIKNIDSGDINCCHCSKCIRTKLELLVSGVLDQAETFPDKAITLDDVRRVKVSIPVQVEFYEALVEPLKALGHSDLSAVLAAELKRFSRSSTFVGQLKKDIKKSAKAGLGLVGYKS